MILATIKERTSKNHIWLEKNPLLLPLSQGPIDLTNYQIILEKFYGFFYPLEQQLNAFPGIKTYLPDTHTRRRAHLLQQDLVWINENRAGEQTGSSANFNVNICQELPPLENDTQAFGCLYVLEGSTLGGRFISKAIREQLGLSATQGGRFFHGYGEETGPKWKAFQQGLSAYCEDTGEAEAVIEAANLTFEKMGCWMNA